MTITNLSIWDKIKSVIYDSDKVVIYLFLSLPFSKFIQDQYNYPEDSPVPSYLAGAVYDVSLLLSPFLGLLIVSKHKDSIISQMIHP